MATTTLLKEKKSALRKTADTSLKPVDLIRPHEKSNLSGYNGYTPQLKFNCGHTYGYDTDKLLQRSAKSTVGVSQQQYETPSSRMNKSDALIQYTGGDDRYCTNMVPGYTGFVPQHKFKYGRTYKEGTKDAILDFKYSDLSKRMDDANFSRTTAQTPRLTVKDDFKKPDNTHPGINVRHMFAYNLPKFEDKRRFTEAPIPNYMGHVPKQEEHILGGRYSFWTKHAYTDALNEILRYDDKKHQKTILGDNKNFSQPLLQTKMYSANYPRNGAVYNKRLGMVPRYTGYIPQFRYEFGNTYGDATRDLPICHDTNGYSTGSYNTEGPIIKSTVIPVRI